jgi:predicted SAM-dependent methyltransferase
MTRLNLGCGSDRRDGCVGVDRVKTPAADVVHDLDTGPWPFDDCTAEAILAKDVFEHVSDPVLFMTECWRILEGDAPLFIRTPYYKHRDAYTDPTHKRFPTEHTFDYWIPGTLLHRLHNAAYGSVDFRSGPMSIKDGAIEVTLFKIPYKVTTEIHEPF